MAYNQRVLPGIEDKAEQRRYLTDILNKQSYLEQDEIDAIFNDMDYFRPLLRQALANRAAMGVDRNVPLDNTDFYAIFLLSQINDRSILPDILTCLRFDEERLEYLYSDAMTEDLWLPIAQIAHEKIENLWDFIIDESVYLYARGAVVTGLIAMAVLSPETRSRVVLFIRKMLHHRNIFEEQWLAGIMSDCGDYGLHELKEEAFAFAETMEITNSSLFLECSAEDVKHAFQRGISQLILQRLKKNIYTCCKEWKRNYLSNLKYGIKKEVSEKEEDQYIPSLKFEKTGRNEPCPCGSGKKYKKCCGS